MQVADDIYKVDGTLGGNVFLVVTADGLLLVDTGMPGGAKRVLASIEGLGRKPADVRSIVLTHSDIDHVRSVAALKEMTGARVAIHELDGLVLEGKAKTQKGGRLTSLLRRLIRVRPATPDLLLGDGDSIGGFTVMHVPGHTPGSIVLHRPDGVVFSGDALLSDRKGNVRPPQARLCLDPALAMASAERIKSLPIRLLLPGHGAPARG